MRISFTKLIAHLLLISLITPILSPLIHAHEPRGTTDILYDTPNALTPIEHKLAHFALGAGMGAGLATVMDPDHVLSNALAAGTGAAIGEAVAEALVDREQIMKDSVIEMQKTHDTFDEDAYRDIYRAKLQPYINAGRLISGSVIALSGHNPTIAIASATNALENNFAGVVPLPELGTIPPELMEQSGKIAAAAKESVVETAEDIYNNPDGYVKGAVLGAVPYGEITERLYLGETVSKLDLAVETGFVLTGTTEFKAAAKTSAKVLGKVASKFAHKLESAGKAGKSSNIEALDLAGGAAGSQKLIKARGTPNAGGTIISTVTVKEEVYYRVFSGNNTSGRFLTKVRPNNAALAQEGLALPSSNTAQFIQEVIVPSGVRLQRSRALPAFGKRGAMEQFEILEAELDKITFKNGIPF